MIKKLNKIILSLVLVMSLSLNCISIVKATSVDDMNLIKNRLKEYFLNLDTIDDGSKVETCYVSHAEDYLSLIQENGSFNDVDYKVTNNAANGTAWSPYLALDRMQAIAIAYHQVGNPIYQKQEVVDKLNKAIVYWKSQDPRSTNWWENQVGVQLRLSRIALFMEGNVSDDALNIMLNKLLEKTPIEYSTGQNNLWFDQNYVYHALISDDATKLKNMITNYMDYCLSSQLDDVTKEAVQVDNSFYMHGRQFYSNGYGMTMFRDMSFWIYMLRGTDFAISQDVVDRMGNYMLNGTSWTIRGDIMELYLGYRPYKYEVGYANYSVEYIQPLKRMIISDPKRASEYQKVLDNIEGRNNSNGKNGNYYMWRSGYASHMRDGYGVNIKMDSKNLIGGEWRGPWNEEGKPNQQLIYWTSTASSTISVDGDEYKSVYPVFDWTHTPGVTAPNYISGKFNLENNELFNIGVSNGQYGATAYKFDKTNTKGQKGYFLFDDEFVSLGANISSTTDSPIHTTLNQSKASDLKVNGEVVELGTVAKEYTTKNIYNNKIGYVFLEDTKVKVSHDEQKDVPSLWSEEMKENADSVFTAYLDHGVKPTNASYAYIVVPNKTEAEVSNYSKNIPVTVVANNSNVQAVRHDGLKQTQINFYKAGSLEYKPGYTITADQACSIIIDESGSTREITAAVNDHEAHKTVNVGLAYNSVKTTTTFISKALPYAGQSMTLTEGEDDRYIASSSTENHFVKNVLDSDNNTYWESQGQGEEWISLLTGSNKYLKDITISWGEKYAREYEVYASEDGENYELVSTVSKGEGKQETVPIGMICNYVKIVMKSSSGNCYQIKEVTMNQGELLSLNKPTTTSSVSSKAPTFVGSLAVDGDLSTRWASNRNSDDEWISVDLEKYARIDAIEVNWENSCSDDYTIEVSSDNTNWKTVKQLQTDSSLKDKINFSESVYGRYVKIHSHKSRLINGTNYGINIFGIKIYGELSKQDEINIALNKPSKASSTYKNTISNFILESRYAFDGSVENNGNTYQSRWVSARGKDNTGKDVTSQYIQVDLEENYYISKVVLNWEGACGKEYKVQVSEDGEIWTDISHITDGVAGIKELKYENSVIGRYVRMQGIIPSGQYGYSLWEFEVYGTSLKAELKEYYDQNKDIDTSAFTPKSIEVYHNALDNSVKVYQDKEATTTQILDAKKQLKDAIDDFVLKANKVALDNEIKKAELIEKDLYTNESIKILEAALTQAKAIYNDDNSIQKEVDDVVKALQQAIQSLEKKVNKVALDNEIKKAELIEKDLYTNESIKILEAALTQAKAIYNDDNSIQKEVDDVVKALQQAIQSLEKKVNKVALDNEIKKAELIEKDLYTNESIKVLEAALTQAKAIYNNDNAIQKEVDDVVKALQQAIQSLEKKVNKVALDNEIKKAELIEKDLYINESIKVLEAALTQAKAIYNNDNAIQKEVDDVVKALQQAIQSLEKKANKVALDNEIKKAELIEKDLYTNESIKILEAALTQAKAIYNDDNAIQKEVDDVVKALQQAIQSLEKKKDDPIIIIPEKNTEIIVQSPNKDVSISGKLPKDIELSSKLLNNEQIKQLIEKIYKVNPGFLKNATLEKTYDLSLFSKNEIYKINEQVEVSLKLNDSLLNKKLGIVYIDKDGNISKIESRVENGFIIFKVNHFSQYAIVSYNERSEIASTDDSNQVNSYIIVMMSSVIMISSAILYVFLSKKKRN